MDIQFLINLVAYFFIYSFFGWILESIVKTITFKKWVNSGFLFGPLCPIYGIGACGMILLLNSFQGNYIVMFVISFFVFSAWEYFVGWLLEKLFNTKYWDYSFYKCQIKGRICLVNSLTWGFLGVAFTEIIHPITSSGFLLIPSNIVNICVGIFTIILVIDIWITIVKIKNINISIKKLREITNNLKEKIEELKKLPNKARKNEKLKSAIEELKQKQAELKMKIEKQTKRLKKAFPNMKAGNKND